MKIEPTYVTFEQAKLLKEKGFDISTNTIFQYNEEENWNRIERMPKYYAQGCSQCSRPEQWQVVEWMRVKHGIWINTGIITLNGGVMWFPEYIIIHNSTIELPKQIEGNFTTPQQAYSSAFDYVLTKLI